MSVSPTHGESAEHLVRCVRYLHGRGWCEGTSGNFSLTLTDDPLRLLMTSTGVDKSCIDPSDLLIVDENGRPTEPTPLRPSAETLLHVALARSLHPNAILHTHSIWGTLLGQRFLSRGGFFLEGYEMLKGIRGVETHEARVFVPVVPNSQDMVSLGTDFARVLDRDPDTRGILIAGHGFYTWGATLDEARRHVEIFEFLFQLAGRRVSLEPFSE